MGAEVHCVGRVTFVLLHPRSCVVCAVASVAADRACAVGGSFQSNQMTLLAQKLMWFLAVQLNDTFGSEIDVVAGSPTK